MFNCYAHGWTDRNGPCPICNPTIIYFASTTEIGKAPPMANEKCELCGSSVRVVGETTLHYEPVNDSILDHTQIGYESSQTTPKIRLPNGDEINEKSEEWLDDVELNSTLTRQDRQFMGFAFREGARWATGYQTPDDDLEVTVTTESESVGPAYLDEKHLLNKFEMLKDANQRNLDRIAELERENEKLRQASEWHLGLYKNFEKTNADLESKLKLATEALEKIDQRLSVPAAEYVPAIWQAFDTIDKALEAIEVNEEQKHQPSR